MALKISDTWLKKQAAPVAGATTFWDSDIPGFGLRVFAPTKRHAAGARSFFVNYRIGGREKRFTIGSYPDWSAEAARGEAKDLWRRIDRGEDPALARKTQREAPTVRDLAERYRVEHLANKAKSSQINDWAMVKNDILPAMGDRKVADVHDGDIWALRNATPARGATVRANRVLAVASKMFALALKRRKARTHRGGIRRRAIPARASLAILRRKGAVLLSRRARRPRRRVADLRQHAGCELPPVHHAHRLSPGRGHARDVGSVRGRARFLDQAVGSDQAAQEAPCTAWRRRYGTRR
jgi:hypothetical protein